jgi:hypothetical protein
MFVLFAWRIGPAQPAPVGEADAVAVVEQGRAKDAMPEAANSRKGMGTTVHGPKRDFTREEFKQLVMGKTEAEVIDLLGRPARTREVEKTPCGPMRKP